MDYYGEETLAQGIQLANMKIWIWGICILKIKKKNTYRFQRGLITLYMHLLIKTPSAQLDMDIGCHDKAARGWCDGEGVPRLREDCQLHMCKICLASTGRCDLWDLLVCFSTAFYNVFSEVTHHGLVGY